MSKSRSQITSKLNDWYDWLIGHVPRTIKDGASRAFKTSDKIMGFYNGFTGNQTQCRIEAPEGAPLRSGPFKPMEQSFEGAYRKL